ncbi:MAG: twin-arginine translocation signal domain-containing protein [Acidimicrobiales bacterium]
MSELSRRAFLIRSSVGAAAVAVGSAVPGLPSILGSAEDDGAAADGEATTAAATGAPSMSQPLIAHVTDLQSGEMSLFMGEQEFTVRDPSLAGRLFGATK